MRNITFILLTLAWFIASCKPDPAPKPDDREPPKQYSYWVVNEDSFRTNNVDKVIGLGASDIHSTENFFTNSFDISFNIGNYLPFHGSFEMNCDGQNPDYVCLGITYKGVSYHKTSTPQYLQAEGEKGKAQYTLQSTWFYNAQNPNDSVLIHGVFNEP